MKSVLISVQPKHCELIANEKETILVKKTQPKLNTPFKCYIYCTKDLKNHLVQVEDNSLRLYNISDIAMVSSYGRAPLFHGEVNGKVIGEFICNEIELLFDTNGNPKNYIKEILPGILQRAAMSFKEFQNYTNNKAGRNSIWGWHISDLVIYDQPKELRGFIASTPKNKFKAHGENLTHPPQSWRYVEE